MHNIKVAFEKLGDFLKISHVKVHFPIGFDIYSLQCKWRAE